MTDIQNNNIEERSNKQPQIRAYQLGEWLLDIHANCLVSDAVRVELEYRQTRILVYLLERPHQIISKDELIKTIWEKKVVNDESLPVAISQIRKALNDNARNPRFIKTIPGVGYQFIAEARAVLEATQQEAVNPKTNKTLAAKKSNQLSAESNFFARLLSSKRPLGMLAVIACVGVVVFAFNYQRLFKQPAVTEAQPSQTICELGLKDVADSTDQQKRERIRDLRLCIQQEPKNAQAYLKLAETKMWLFGDSMGQPENSAEIFALLEHSLQLDPNLARAHLWIGYLKSRVDSDDKTADLHFQQALALAPKDELIHMHYAHFLFVHERFHEARTHLQAKRDINPLTYSQTDLVWLYILQGDYDKAEQELQRISSTEDQDEYFHIASENVYLRKGEDQKAFAEMRWFFANANFSAEKIKNLEKIFAEHGLRGVFAQLYEQKESAELGQFTPPISLARYAILAGKPEDAKIYLKAAYEQRNVHSECTIADPFFNALLKQRDVKLWMLKTQVSPASNTTK